MCSLCLWHFKLSRDVSGDASSECVCLFACPAMDWIHVQGFLASCPMTIRDRLQHLNNPGYKDTWIADGCFQAKFNSKKRLVQYSSTISTKLNKNTDILTEMAMSGSCLTLINISLDI